MFHLLCCVHDYDHLHHHHHIPVGIRSKHSLHLPRKYNQKLHFPACTCSSASCITPSFPSSQTGNWSQSEFTTTGSPVPTAPSELGAAVQDGGPMLMPSACQLTVCVTWTGGARSQGSVSWSVTLRPMCLRFCTLKVRLTKKRRCK